MFENLDSTMSGEKNRNVNYHTGKRAAFKKKKKI